MQTINDLLANDDFLIQKYSSLYKTACILLLFIQNRAFQSKKISFFIKKKKSKKKPYKCWDI